MNYSDNVLAEAQRLYFKHLQLNQVHYWFLWDQCSKEYKEAWLLIATTDLED